MTLRETVVELLASDDLKLAILALLDSVEEDLMPPNVVTWDAIGEDKSRQYPFHSRDDAINCTLPARIACLLKWTHTPDGEFVSVEPVDK